MYTVTRTQVRPSTSVNFYIPQWSFSSPEEIEYCINFSNNYVQTMFWLTSQFEYSEDNLTLTMHNIWQSEEQYLNFKSDPLGLARFESLIDAYCLENNITHQLVTAVTS
jgi:hypothetical protein